MSKVKRISSKSYLKPSLKKIIYYLFSLIVIFSLFLNYFLLQKIKGENLVVKVADGDTFQLKSGKRVRLMGVDAPELSRCGGKEAKDFLEGFILNKNVTLKEETSEAYGRSLALVYFSGNLVNEKVLLSGWGRTDYRENSQREVLTKAYHQARDNTLGIFSSLCRYLGESIDSECVIKGNIDQATSEKFYHLPNCRHYSEVVIDQDRGEKFFCSEEEAVISGFRQASGCL